MKQSTLIANTAANLKTLRKRSLLTQTQFADLFGITKQTVAVWELQRGSMPLGVVVNICEHYQVPIKKFIYTRL